MGRIARRAQVSERKTQQQLQSPQGSVSRADAVVYSLIFFLVLQPACSPFPRFVLTPQETEHQARARSREGSSEENPLNGGLQIRSTLGLIFAEQAATADVVGGCSR